MEQHIQRHAEFYRNFAKEHWNVDLGHDLEGVRWADGYIVRERAGATSDEAKEKIVNSVGSYLGECIRRTYGGKWLEHDRFSWGVLVEGGVTVFPFNKVQKHLDNADGAEGDSVLSMFMAVPSLLVIDSLAPSPVAPVVATQEAPSASRDTAQKRPWWKFW